MPKLPWARRMHADITCVNEVIPPGGHRRSSVLVAGTSPQSWAPCVYAWHERSSTSIDATTRGS